MISLEPKGLSDTKHPGTIFVIVKDNEITCISRSEDHAKRIMERIPQSEGARMSIMRLGVCYGVPTKYGLPDFE